MRDYGAAPNEHLLQLSLASSLFPHLAQKSRTAFRLGLAILLVALVAFTLLRPGLVRAPVDERPDRLRELVRMREAAHMSGAR